MDLWGTLVLLVSTVLASALLTAALFAAMFSLHILVPDKFPNAAIGAFNFRNITRPALADFLTRLSVIIFPPTILLPILTFILFPPLSAHGFRAHYISISIAIFLFEYMSIAAGFLFYLKLDRTRAIIFSALGALCYFLLFWAMIYNYLYS